MCSYTFKSLFNRIINISFDQEMYSTDKIVECYCRFIDKVILKR